MNSYLEHHSLADPDIQEDPEAYYAALHTQPIYFDPNLGVYICSTYPEMREILRDTARFSSVGSQTMDALREPPPEAIAIRDSGYARVDTLVTCDPPRHTRVREMMNPPFRRRQIERLVPRIREIVNTAIDGFIDEGQCNIVDDLAIPVPITVIAEMLGLPHEMTPDIKRWSDASVEPLGMMVSDQRLIDCAREIKAFQDCIVAELESRTDQPRDDLLTHLAQARDADGNLLTVEEQLSITQQLLVAGNETTTNGIAAGAQLLVNHPQTHRAIADDPTKAIAFTNEVLRLESPVQGLFRIVAQETEIAGVRLPKGARVMCRFAAANRDPGKYAEPNELDLCRRNTGTHVAFGAGIHHCIGANLAREEMNQTFALLCARTSDLAFAPGKNDFAHHPSMVLRGLKALHITFHQTEPTP